MGLPAPKLTPKYATLLRFRGELMDRYHGPVAGIDEAGRGPWAGPVVVAAVILNPDRIPEGLNDSKLLTPEAREDRYVEIIATAIVSVVIGHVRRIDRDNILQASLWGMRMAYRGLGVPAGCAADRRQYHSEALPLPGARRDRRRRAVALGGRGLDRGQGHARPDDGEARAPLSPLWLGVQQRLRHQASMRSPSRSTASACITAARSARSRRRFGCS